MQIIAVDYPEIRRLEAISFRAFPATTTFFNGTWAVRLSAGLPSKRINSITPLDPHDSSNIEHRVEQEIRRFENFGRPPTFRITPLASKNLVSFLKNADWDEFDQSVVMTMKLRNIDLDHATNRLPFKDTGLWVDAYLSMQYEPSISKPGTVEMIEATKGQTGLFLLQDETANGISALRAVLDSELVGLFNIATQNDRTRQGHATSLISSALLWARYQGATLAWLQVECVNQAAISLYESMGFQIAYRYVYCRQQQSV